MQTDLTADELEALGRETAGRLGVEPQTNESNWHSWHGVRLPHGLKAQLITDYTTIPVAYIALGRAVHAARLAVGYYDAVAAERDRCISYMKTYPLDGVYFRQDIENAIRKGAHHD